MLDRFQRTRKTQVTGKMALVEFIKHHRTDALEAGVL